MKIIFLSIFAALLFGCHSSSDTDADSETDTDSTTDTHTAAETDSEEISSTDSAKPDSNMPCRPEDADNETLACTTWAKESGVCTDSQTACRINPDCLAYLGCYDAAFSLEDYEAERQRCNELYPDGSEDYWTYMRCVYCYACGDECADVSGAVCFW